MGRCLICVLTQRGVVVVCTYRSFEALRKEFAQEGSVQLQKFLCAERSQLLSAALAQRDNADFNADKWPAPRSKPSYTDGLTSTLKADGREVAANGDGWGVVGPAHMQRYLRFGLSHDVAPAPASDEGAAAQQGGPCQAGKELATIKDVLFGSVSFARLMYAMTGLRPVGMTAEARRFRPGLDYTVAHHGLLEQEARLDATLSFVVGGGSDKVNIAQMRRHHCMQPAIDIVQHSGDPHSVHIDTHLTRVHYCALVCEASTLC